MRSYQAVLFVLHVESFKARAMSAPRSRAVKKPHGASLNDFLRVHLITFPEFSFQNVLELTEKFGDSTDQRFFLCDLENKFFVSSSLKFQLRTNFYN